MPHSPEAGSPRSKCCQVWSLVRPLAGLQVALSQCVLTWSFPCARVDMVSLPLLIRTPILLDQGPSLLTSFNLRPLLEAPANADAPRGTALTHEVWGVHNSPSSSFLMTHYARGSDSRPWCCSFVSSTCTAGRRSQTLTVHRKPPS